MSDKAMMQQLLGEVARWARANHKPRPSTPDGWRMLMAEFMAQQPAWDEIPDAKPLHLDVNGAGVDIVDTMTQQQYDDDDFAQEVEKRNQALVDNGGDDLRRDVALQGAQHAELNAQAPFTRNNPPSALKASLGGQQLVASNTLGAQCPMIANWVGDSDAETTAVTIELGQVNSVPISSLASTVRPFAIVNFGTKGFLLSAEVDIGQGCQLTVGASQVNVAVGMDAARLGNAGKALLTAMLSFTPIVRAIQLTRTRYLDNVPQNSANAPTPVPPFAKNVLFYTNFPTAAYALSFTDVTGTQQYVVTIAASSPIMTVPIPLSGDIAYVTVTETTNLGPTVCKLVFGLAL